jgi:hypothetical protein
MAKLLVRWSVKWSKDKSFPAVYHLYRRSRMKEIPRTKKLEVAQYYIPGYPYSDIENRVGVSHGSIKA